MGTLRGYVDAHIHLADRGYQGRVPSILEDATQHKIAHLLSNAVDYETSVQTLELAKQHEGFVLAAIGLHPSTVVSLGNSEQYKIEALLGENREHVKAIGEIGLDGKYTQDQEKLDLQVETFRFFLNLAEKRRLPVVIHSRSALPQILDELVRFSLTGVLLHWYDGPLGELKLIQDKGWLISIGPALFYSKRIEQVALAADESIILTETDGPVPHRGPFLGKATTPSHVAEVVRKLSELKSTDVNEMRNTLLSNFQRFLKR